MGRFEDIGRAHQGADGDCKSAKSENPGWIARNDMQTRYRWVA
jgi:hypothetical protein